MEARNLEVLRHPLLRNLSLSLLSLAHGHTRLESALDNQRSEPIVQQVALRLQ